MSCEGPVMYTCRGSGLQHDKQALDINSATNILPLPMSDCPVTIQGVPGPSAQYNVHITTHAIIHIPKTLIMLPFLAHSRWGYLMHVSMALFEDYKRCCRLNFSLPLHGQGALSS